MATRRFEMRMEVVLAELGGCLRGVAGRLEGGGGRGGAASPSARTQRRGCRISSRRGDDATAEACGARSRPRPEAEGARAEPLLRRDPCAIAGSGVDVGPGRCWSASRLQRSERDRMMLERQAKLNRGAASELVGRRRE